MGQDNLQTSQANKYRKIFNLTANYIYSGAQNPTPYGDWGFNSPMGYQNI